MMPRGKGKSHTHTYPHASDKHDHATPIESQDNKNNKNVLHNSNSQGDYTSSTHSLIIQYNRSPKTGKNHNNTPLGISPLRTEATSQSNISSSGLEAGAPLSLPPTEMSNFRNQTDKAARSQSDRGPVPTPTSSWIAQTKQCR